MNHPGFLAYIDEEDSGTVPRPSVLARLPGINLFEIMIGELAPSQAAAGILTATASRPREVAAAIVDLEHVRHASLSFDDREVVDRVSDVIAILFEWLDLRSTD